MDLSEATKKEITRLARRLMKTQSEDGAWRFCFENGPLTDVYMVILLRVLESADEDLIRKLAERIAVLQHPNGAWKLFEDEDEGNLSATIEAYTALLYSGYHTVSDPRMKLAEAFILKKGGLVKAHPSTKFILALNHLYPWPNHFPLPLWLMHLRFSPFQLESFSAYARVHLASIIVVADRKFSIRTHWMSDLSHLRGNNAPKFQRLRTDKRPAFFSIRSGWSKKLSPGRSHSVQKAEQYLLCRIERDGTLFNYATATFFMIYALLALGYKADSPVISHAVLGLKSHLYPTGNTLHLQNSPSDIWDSALISYALQEAGISSEHPQIKASADYLFNQQHNRSSDQTPPYSHAKTGWGFSKNNTMNPDVDDTQAVLRATCSFVQSSGKLYESWMSGCNWLFSMQNSDGGWGGFAKNGFSRLVALLPITGIRDTGIDPSTADITGRVLEFLSSHLKLTLKHPRVQSAVRWLIRNQEADGSWYGRWGVSYIYGTWAAVTGLIAAGLSAEHPTIRKALRWLLDVQHPSGGWGESCHSDRMKAYIALPFTTPSQTAWALDTLLSVQSRRSPEMDKGIRHLTKRFPRASRIYPTGAGLPGQFYIRYHSYNWIWPLITLSHYQKKFGTAEVETEKGGECDAQYRSTLNGSL
jgi:sporulenol synthase